MTLRDILKKYSIYDIEYKYMSCILIIHKAIPVKKFITLKLDLIKNKIFVREIIVKG